MESEVGAGSWTPILGATGLTYDVPAGLTQTTLYIGVRQPIPAEWLTPTN